MAAVATATIETKIPARLDRLPWARFHRLIVVGLGTVWILDGLEVTIVGSISSRLTSAGSGIHITAAQIGVAGAVYVGGACSGALVFGQLTDRFGRKRLFMVTLGLYIVATVATAASFSAWYFFIARLFTGFGIGGEYSAINSAIDELIPARMRGTVDLSINGSYWFGSMAGAGAAILFLNTYLFPRDFGWRLTFALGACLAVGILIVRRHVPESPRWLFIHGREEEAERIVDEIEAGIEQETGSELPVPEQSITVRQRTSISFREIAAVAFKTYPKRALLGLALFVGQAFIYNGITFNLGDLFTKYYGVSSGFVPVFSVIYAFGNLAGPLLLGRLYDTVGRKPMITATYIGSSLLGVGLAIGFTSHFWGGPWIFVLMLVMTFALASAGASAAYLTVSEVFPMETRALAIAFFYAVGTGIGGAAGPLLFGSWIASGMRGLVARAFLLGSGLMALGGIAEIFFGVKAEQASLEDIAQPLTAAEAEQGGQRAELEGGRERAAEKGAAEKGAHRAGEPEPVHAERLAALDCRAEAEEARAEAADHRSAALRLLAGEPDDERRQRAEVERSLAEIAELRAGALDQRAQAHDSRAAAGEASEEAESLAERQRSLAAEARADAGFERAEALASNDEEERRRHEHLAEAAAARARAHEHRAEESTARIAAEHADGPAAVVCRARETLKRRWAEREEELAFSHQARADGELRRAEEHERRAGELEGLARADEEAAGAAEHRQLAEEERREREREEHERQEQQRGVAEAERRRARSEREQELRRRLAERQRAGTSGLAKLRPGPGRRLSSPGMIGNPPAPGQWHRSEEDLAREADAIGRALEERGPLDRRELERVVGARYWGPGRFRPALREAVRVGLAVPLSRTTFAPPSRGEQGGDRWWRRDSGSGRRTGEGRESA